jgi:hypothetical protein
MSKPSLKTIKRLFAVSGNKCAFPNCSIPLVDQGSGKVTGKICHIKARQPGGPRYDPNQTEEERHNFENLVLMCPIHHDVIDSDPISYTVERLSEIKAQHESKHQGGKEASDSVANQLLINITGNVISHGSLIFSQNQMGGQVAHSITNIGPQPRRISPAAANALVAELRNYPPEEYDITSLMSDAETHQLASIIEQILKLAGWKSEGVAQSVFTGLPRGVIIQTPVEKPSLHILLNWMAAVGFKPQGELVSGSNKTCIIIGTNL